MLRSPVFAPLDLAAATARLAGRAPLSGDVLPLQAIESVLAPADPPSADRTGLASAGGIDATEALAVPSPAGAACCLRRPPDGGNGRIRRSLIDHFTAASAARGRCSCVA